jgi:hypothetical protein
LFIDQLPFAVAEISINQVQFILIVAIVCSVFIYLKNHRLYFVKASLVFALLLSLTTLAIKFKRLNYNELIVYNTTKNPAIHLIHGRKNYIISEEKILEEELNYFPGTVTRKKLGLNQPTYLISADTLTDESLLLKDGLVIFEGKSISLLKNTSILNKNNLPDLIINPANTDFDLLNYESGTTIISNKRFFGKNSNISTKIHFTPIKGAFRKKW